MMIEKKKNNPVGVRFGEAYEELKSTEPSITTHQKALNFLFDFWKNNRPNTIEVKGGMVEKKPAETKIDKKQRFYDNEIFHLTEKLKNPPANLKGIELTMWKNEIKEKINELSTLKK